jgi:hypothetical protein
LRALCASISFPPNRRIALLPEQIRAPLRIIMGA